MRLSALKICLDSLVAFSPPAPYDSAIPHAPLVDKETAMLAKRPSSVTAAGVLAIIYGSLFTLCGMCTAINLAAQGAMGGGNPFAGGDPLQAKLQEELQKVIEREAPAYQAVQIGGTVLGLAESVALLVGGIGLIGMRPWARTVTLTFTWMGIATSVLQAAYTFTFVLPAMNKAFQIALPAAMGPGPGPAPAQLMQVVRATMNIMIVLTIIVYVLTIMYLAIILILLMRSNVRLAFAAAARGDFGPEDETRPNERERWRDERSDDEDWRRPPPADPKDEWGYR
jgi:hypothetical protein